MYRYRPIHAIFEKVLALVSPLLPGIEGQPLDAPPRRVLVLKFGGMGEAVLARSLVDRLLERNPGISFDYLVEKRTAETMTRGSSGRVFTYSPGVDGMGNALATLLKIRANRYDAVLDFEQHSLLTAAFARATSIPVRVGFLPPAPDVPGPRQRMFTHPIQLREEESMWSAFIRVGQVLDSCLPASLMTVPLPDDSKSDAWFKAWWGRHNISVSTRVVALHLGVGPSAQYRRWPVERFVDLANSIAAIRKDLVILLTGAESEQSLITEFRDRFAGQSIDASELGGLGNTEALLKRCDLLVSADTGIMHLAAALGTPTIGLFGPNTPVCWAPVGESATYVYPRQQPCSPCINSYRRHIPEKCTASVQSACMWDITVPDVLSAARHVVKGSWLD